ncbi:calcium:proton antiporter [Candidatus Phycosocius spiralis]|uniref:Ionic antiporter n=1 Tax=Candidatus Phycosocius spiralis TaxID=2815099 RepID=A0ABQ4PSF9_9PROT|nr:ionic transporter y4hA [Candidatus Phycosocius spiralis]GIU65939.1 ionic antiporter [Candidatus Phycosocius spiralis]
MPSWTLIAPLTGWIFFAVYYVTQSPIILVGLGLALFVCVLAAVHHAEVIAHKVGEPFGTFLFAVAVTIIEVGLIVSIMLAGGPAAETLARDTVMAAIMIILNGVIGSCLFLGGLRHGEQTYMQTGVSAALATLATLSIITLILPNHVTTLPGPVFAPAQLAFVGVVSFVLYASFVMIQTIRHRAYFMSDDKQVMRDETIDETTDVPLPSNRLTLTSGAFLMMSLVAIVWIAKTLAPTVELIVASAGAPKAIVGVIIAGVVLLPEGIAAVRAARANRLQTSLNLALGSALATIGLTIPVVAALALIFDWKLLLGVNQTNMVLLVLTLLVSTLSLSTGRTTIMQGAVHLVLFAVFLFMLLVP